MSASNRENGPSFVYLRPEPEQFRLVCPLFSHEQAQRRMLITIQLFQRPSRGIVNQLLRERMRRRRKRKRKKANPPPKKNFQKGKKEEERENKNEKRKFKNGYGKQKWESFLFYFYPQSHSFVLHWGSSWLKKKLSLSASASFYPHSLLSSGHQA